jgi:hypothetical protein
VNERSVQGHFRVTEVTKGNGEITEEI